MTTTEKTAAELKPRDLIVVFDDIVQAVRRVEPYDQGDGVARWLVHTYDSTDHHGSTTMVDISRKFEYRGRATGRQRRTPTSLERTMGVMLR